MRWNSIKQGQHAEDAALAYLHKQGLRTVARNYRCRGGEIDLIMQDATELVFVEVRLRRNTQFASAMESVDRQKQRRLVTAARHYLQHIGRYDAPCRFDVVGIDGQGTIDWQANAFDLT